MAVAGKKSVVFAVFVNLAITILKMVAFSVSGSGAMLAEGIHSFADTLNQALLWIGIEKSERPADKSHPYGYGAERYVWSLISAMGIFFLGCGVTVYHGIQGILHPHHADVGVLTWAVLGISITLEGAVLFTAVFEARKTKGEMSWTKYLKTSRDPTLLAVLFEDSIAVLGIILAVVGIGLSHLTGNPIFDALASIFIGLLLGFLALVLAYKNRTLLVGQAASPEIEAKIRRIVSTDPAIEKLISMRTRVLAADAHLVDLQVDFNADEIIQRLLPAAMEELRQEVTEEALQKFGRQVVEELATEVDRLEARIKEAVPTAQIIDVEGD